MCLEGFKMNQDSSFREWGGLKMTDVQYTAETKKLNQAPIHINERMHQECLHGVVRALLVSFSLSFHRYRSLSSFLIFCVGAKTRVSAKVRHSWAVFFNLYIYTFVISINRYAEMFAFTKKITITINFPRNNETCLYALKESNERMNKWMNKWIHIFQFFKNFSTKSRISTWTHVSEPCTFNRVQMQLFFEVEFVSRQGKPTFSCTFLTDISEQV